MEPNGNGASGKGKTPATQHAKKAAMADDRRARVAHYKTRGLSVRQVIVKLAEEGCVNPKTGAPWSLGIVSADLAKLEESWKASALADTDTWKRNELAKLAEIEREACEAWSRGIGKKQKTVSERNQGGKGTQAKVAVTTEEQNGDPRYLAVMLDCQARRAKLLGLDEAQKHQHSGTLQLSDAERTKRIEELLAGKLAAVAVEPVSG
jgi:hypothetical protein